MSEWTDQERLAALKRLRDGVDAAIEVLSDRTKLAADETGADRWRTDFGTVSIAERKPAVYIRDQKAFVEHVRKSDPEAIEESVAEWKRKAIMTALRIHDGKVFWAGDLLNAPPVPWAGVKPGSRYVTVRADEDAKSQAIDWALAWVDSLPKELGS